MSDSRRKIAICGLCKRGSEKDYKRRANRGWRRFVRQILKSQAVAEVLPLPRELSNVRRWVKDGKALFNPALFPQWMRK